MGRLQSTVWAQLATEQMVAWAVPFINGNTLAPDIDNGSTGLTLNLAYTLETSPLGAGGLHIGTFGNTDGKDVLNLGAQGNSFIPVGDQLPLVVGRIPGFTTSSCRGSRALKANSLDGDLLGEFAGYGLTGASSPLAWERFAGIKYYVDGASATDPGGKARLGTKANAGDYAEWIELNSSGQFYPLTTNTVRLGKADKGWSALNLAYTITGTVGAVQIDKPAGRAIIALGASTVVVTNSLVTANSIVIAQLAAVDATLTFVKAVVPAAGSFTIHGNANATANCAVNFLVISTDS